MMCAIGFIGDDILPSYLGIIISQYKDPYEPTMIQWKARDPVIFLTRPERLFTSELIFSQRSLWHFQAPFCSWLRQPCIWIILQHVGATQRSAHQDVLIVALFFGRETARKWGKNPVSKETNQPEVCSMIAYRVSGCARVVGCEGRVILRNAPDVLKHQQFLPTWNAFCVLFFWQLEPLKPATRLP